MEADGPNDRIALEADAPNGEAFSPTEAVPTPRTVEDQPTRADRIFDLITTTSAAVVLALLGLIALFLVLRSRPAFQAMGLSFFTETKWNTSSNPPQFGVLALLTGTITVALVAVVIAVPLGVCAALFINDYAPPRLRRFLGSVVDLLAAIPSILYGLWGLFYLGAQIAPLSAFLARHFGWIPIFGTEKNANFAGSMFVAGIVVSLMVLPIVAAVSREVFARTPPGEKEAALALGGTRWGMIRTVVLPYGRGGIIGGSMLGLGRALGETMAVVLILPQVPLLTTRLLQNGGATIAGFIAARRGGSDLSVSGL
ncbi:MAG: phosphate ABC transporter permease subunit PstC, partial [Mycobacterium sp.]|nr:phosphate ABC transporter permease subunit PstC [Mycobacterium sp.]